jgi:hypothetical protein
VALSLFFQRGSHSRECKVELELLRGTIIVYGLGRAADDGIEARAGSSISNLLDGGLDTSSLGRARYPLN